MAKHFIGVDTYKISPEWAAPRKKKTLLLGLAALYVVRKYQKTKKSSGGSGKIYASKDTRQRCTVKMHYSKSIEAHKEQINSYLVKEGKGREGKVPPLYGTDVKEYKKHMVDKNFRIFLSPSSNTIPLSILAKKFVDALQSQTGYKISWIAAEHYDTAHPHVHILINGKDQKGKDIFFPRDLVKTFMRENAKNLCTSLIGSRTKDDIKCEINGSLSSSRFTNIDKDIADRIRNNSFFLTGFEKRQIIQRLEYLKTLNLCVYNNNTYTFIEGWEENLKINGRFNAFLQSKKELHFTNPLNHSLYQGEPVMVTGIISKIYKTDEVSDNHAILLETEQGKSYFIPLFQKPQVRQGDTVIIKGEKNQKGRLMPQITRLNDERKKPEWLLSKKQKLITD